MKKIYRIIAHEHLQRKNPRNHKIFLETQNLKFNSVYGLSYFNSETHTLLFEF